MNIAQKENDYPYEEYKKQIINTYHDERREVYYYPIIKELISKFCSEKEKVVMVFDNKGKSRNHDKNVYAGEGGLQDLIIVPKKYCYEKPVSPYITVEIKMPDMDLEEDTFKRYNAIKWKNRDGGLNGQLRTQFRRTSYIIYTDCITWYFLKRCPEPEKDPELKKICLLEENGDHWGFTHEPKEWIELKKYLCEFIKISKEHDIEC